VFKRFMRDLTSTQPASMPRIDTVKSCVSGYGNDDVLRTGVLPDVVHFYRRRSRTRPVLGGSTNPQSPYLGGG
jgi:hypothetical protein